MNGGSQRVSPLPTPPRYRTLTTPPHIYAGSASWPVTNPDPIVTIGNFDGVHIGHRALIARARSLAGPDRPVAVLTFDPTPREVLRGEAPTLLQSTVDRTAALGAAGADHVIIEPFSRTYASYSAEAFAQEILTDRLHAAGIVVGWDFRFGRDRGGDVHALERALTVPVDQVAGVVLDGEIVSSTRIRQALTNGDVAAAARWLGRPHTLIGPVVAGDARGRTIGIPTANVRPAPAAQPAPGVYAVRARLEPNGPWWDAVANLGVRPQFGPTEGRLEVHVLDRDLGDTTGLELRVAFIERLRGEQRFESIDALVAQIHADIARARSILAQAHA